MNKKKLVLSVVVVLAAALVAGGVYYLKHKKKGIKSESVEVTLQDGTKMRAYKLPPITPEERRKKMSATVQGRVDSVKVINDVSQIIIRGNDGVIYAVANPPFVNALRINNMGKIVTLKGYWYNMSTINGDEHRTIWIETFTVVEKINVKNSKKTK